MKTLQFLIIGFILLTTLSLSAQKQTYEFRTSSVGGKLQSEVGKDYRYVGFVIKDIKNNIQKEALQKALSSNSLFQKIQINSVNEFHGFIHKSLKAQDVRKILLKQGVDFEFDQYKFKGLYRAEQLKQKTQQQKK